MLQMHCCFDRLNKILNLKNICFWVEKNEIYMKNNFVQHKDENIATGILKTDNSIFENKDVLQIGGIYRNRYAIVKN